MTHLLKGKLIRLTAESPQTLAEPYSRWAGDSEYWRLLTSDVPRLYSIQARQKRMEAALEKDEAPDNFFFNIRTLADDRLVGAIELDGIRWAHGEAFVGISIADREYWGKGYGTDAMRVILRYAFLELNLRRVSLDTFEYNPRAVRSYEKAGFKHEGRMRFYLKREGRRWDMLFMGILRHEWLALPETER